MIVAFTNCPHCGARIRVHARIDSANDGGRLRDVIAYCEDEDNPELHCDKRFVVQTHFALVVSKTSKIIDEDEKVEA